ncbi:MAG: MBL fold metallo-hydrolase [Thermodesulfobacteriota bacterium]
MRIVCLGACRTVTGSCFLVEMDGSGCFLVDCGLYQGGTQIEQRNRSTGPYRVADLKGLFLTHAHMDHSGLVPRLVRQGYRGPIWATDATCDLLKVLWLDGAHIQEMEAEWQTRKNKRGGRRLIEPLYETPDAEKAAGLLKPLDLDTEVQPLAGVTARFVTAGHILGAASLHLTLAGNDGVHRVGFSGDLGRPGQLIVPDPETMPRSETLFMETTYGGRLHKSLDASQAELIGVVEQAYQEKGKVIIPAFAIERTQEIIYTLAQAFREGRMPKDMPVFLDSPLAIKSTVIFRQNPEFFDDITKALVNEGHTPINLPNLKFTPDSEQSRKINDFMGPAVIIAGSGMANAGRVKHHLKHNLWRPNTHVVIVGFQAQGTTGRKLVEGAQRVKLFREDVAVKAKVHTIGGFSAHADQAELLAWLAPQAHPGLTVNLVHGEESSMMAFKQAAEERFPEVTFREPRWKDSLLLGPVRVEAPPVEAAVPEFLAARTALLEQRLDRFRERLAGGELRVSEEALLALERALDQAERAV